MAIVGLMALSGGAVIFLRSGGPRAPASGAPPADRTAPAGPDDAADFVGSAACAVCHERIAHTFAQHPMANSMSPVSGTLAIADRAEFRKEPFLYRVEQVDGSLWHHEILSDANGRTITDQAAQVVYALGSGVRGKSYVIDRGGWLFQSPISWFSEKECWDLSPGFSRERSTRFERRIGDECLSCHAGRVARRDARQKDVYQAPPFLEASIGCERCHGPGRRHVELFESQPSAAPQDRRIVNPARLENALRDAVCFQCHLSANRVLRHGRSHTDFRPGQPLEDVWAVLVNERDASAGALDRAVSHVEQMCASTCRIASNGRLGCTTCHDPHSVPSSESKAAYYRARCESCHAADACREPAEIRRREPFADSCIACHMPRRGAADIPHTTQTDHRIVRSSQRAGGRSRPERPRPDSPGGLDFFGDAGRRLPDWEVRRSRGLALFAEAQRNRDDRLVTQAREVLFEADRLAPGDAAVLQALGWIHYLADDDRQAQPLLEAAAAVSPDDENTQQLLGIIGFRTGDYTAGLAHLERAVPLNPFRAEIHARRAHMQAAFGDLHAAIESAERGLELAPSLIPLRAAIVEWYASLGDLEHSREHRAVLERLRRVLPES